MRALQLFALACVLAACESAVHPIVGSDRPFTMWGFMNAGADTQYVRVFPIDDELFTGHGDDLDARFFSIDLTTGEEREWTYEKVRFDSTGAGHVFRAPFRAIYGHRYRVNVVRSDGESSHAEVSVPPASDFSIDVQDAMTQFPVVIEGEVPNLIGPKVTYYAINVPPAPQVDSEPIHPPVLFPVTVSYDAHAERQARGWILQVDMVRDEAAVRDEFRRNCLITPSVPNIWLQKVVFTAVVADSAWRPPGGTFDPNVLVVPGTMSNVVNGYGFIGAGEGIEVEWTPSVDARLLAGYRPETSCEAGPAPEECSTPVVPPIPCIGDRAVDVWRNFLR